jgi:hypothetical protein
MTIEVKLRSQCPSSQPTGPPRLVVRVISVVGSYPVLIRLPGDLGSRLCCLCSLLTFLWLRSASCALVRSRARTCEEISPKFFCVGRMRQPEPKQQPASATQSNTRISEFNTFGVNLRAYRHAGVASRTTKPGIPAHRGQQSAQNSGGQGSEPLACTRHTGMQDSSRTEPQGQRNLWRAPGATGMQGHRLRYSGASQEEGTGRTGHLCPRWKCLAEITDSRSWCQHIHAPVIPRHLCQLPRGGTCSLVRWHVCA